MTTTAKTATMSSTLWALSTTMPIQALSSVHLQAYAAMHLQADAPATGVDLPSER